MGASIKRTRLLISLLFFIANSEIQREIITLENNLNAYGENYDKFLKPSNVLGIS
jgi:hypothetical protein